MLLSLVAPSLRAEEWPGPSPCDTTLQACIDGVAAGGTVFVATETPVEEDLVIAKTLTLTRQSGFSPTIVGIVRVESGASPVSIEVNGLAIEGAIDGVVRAGELEVRVIGNTITGDRASFSAIDLRSDPLLSATGDLHAEVSDNVVRVNGDPSGSVCGGVLVLATASPRTTARIERNDLFVAGCPQGSAVGVASGQDRDVVVDVVRNRIDLSTAGFGIRLDSLDPGSTLEARVAGNLVRGEGFSVGVEALDTASGLVSVEVVDNTIVDHDAGLFLIANQGSPLTGQVANNIVARNLSEGIRIAAAGVSNRNNLVFENGVENFPPGPGTITADPQFEGGPSFRLLPTSPAIDAGANDAVPADLALDLDANPRIQGGAVDLGAYEAPGAAGVATPVPTLSDLGLLAFGLLVALGGIRRLRRGPRAGSAGA